MKGKPTVIIMDTVKGKGVSFMENVAEWHGKAPSKELMWKALKELGLDKTIPVKEMEQIAESHQRQINERLKKKVPSFKNDYWWNSSQVMQVEMNATRNGWGEAIAEMGDNERICTIHADISDSIRICKFEESHPERKKRVCSVGIAEQNMMLVAAGLAKEGKIPITGTYGVFASGRPWDQIRTTICYADLNVKIGGAHGGISVGPDGATHQSLEEIALMNILPRMRLFVPCDYIETKKATKESTLNVVGPCYVRFAREATPVVTKPETPFVLGKANVIRFRKETQKFVDAFETVLGEEYENENEDLSFIACGPMVAEAMRAAWILKKEFNVETRVVNVHTVKPIDEETIIKAARETKAIITAEEHQVGGFGNIVAGVIARDRDFEDDFVLDMVGVKDRFGESGQPWELMKEFELTAEFLVEKALKLLEKKKK
jgi:transketolase